MPTRLVARLQSFTTLIVKFLLSDGFPLRDTVGFLAKTLLSDFVVGMLPNGQRIICAKRTHPLFECNRPTSSMDTSLATALGAVQKPLES